MDLPVDYRKLSWQERREVRQQYVEQQLGCCHYCGASLSSSPEMKKRIDWGRFPKNFLQHPIHLHHCHNSGMTIGAVHAYCNAILWQYYGE